MKEEAKYGKLWIRAEVVKKISGFLTAGQLKGSS
jgi:hypothetical protein